MVVMTRTRVIVIIVTVKITSESESSELSELSLATVAQLPYHTTAAVSQPYLPNHDRDSITTVQ